jgi:hypothetical protein
MTEKQGVACGDPSQMLKVLRDNGRLSERKTRVFAVACCRSVWPPLGQDSRSGRGDGR